MSEWLAATDWPAVVAWGAWLGLAWVTVRMAWMWAVAIWQAARAILRAVHTLSRVIMAKRGVRA
jgi:hypothetical protein